MQKCLFAVVSLVLFMNGCSSRQSVKITPLSSTRPTHIAQSLEDIIKEADPNVNIGISIQSLTSGKMLYEKNSDRHFVPCSTMKVVTLAAALHYLGPSYRFTTKLLSNETVKPHGVVDNLYLKGSGDPSLMDYELVLMAQELAQRGIKTISGDIVIDDFIFDDVLWGRGDMWDDRNKGYAAPVAGINVNYNRIQVKTVPSLIQSGNAVPVLWPKTNYVAIESIAKTAENNTNITLLVERDKNRSEWPQSSNDGIRRGDKIVVKGQISKNSEGHFTTVAVNDPGMFAATILKEELERLGVTIKGKISRGKTPENAMVLTQHDSRSLAEALIDFTKVSNNVAHDTLVKAIAAESGVMPATSQAGLKRIVEFLKSNVGVEANELVAADGAGLSRYNLITPNQMVKLLDYSANHFHMGAEFMAALSFGGEDGLIRSRLTADAVRGQVRAKSGTMSGLSSLVGYLTDNKGERYAFAIMINNFVGSVAPYVALQDRILTSLLTTSDVAVAKVK